MDVLFPEDELTHVFELSAAIWGSTQRLLETKLRPMSMTYPQFGALLALDVRDGVSQRELGEMVECDRTTTSVICDSLEKRGWAERRSDPADRRANQVFLTDAGRAALGEARGIVWAAYGLISGVLSREEIATVTSKLERIYEAVKTVPKETA
jgi:DNA-binding MarR family transcriptional regulator